MTRSEDVDRRPVPPDPARRDRDVPDDDLDTDVDFSADPDDDAEDDDDLSDESDRREDPPFRTPHAGDRLTEHELAEDSSDS